MLTRSTDILILGAGLAGTGVALELARRGIPATLLDQDAVPLNRASLRNEGKIHLGLIYANDRSLATAFRQLDGALRFRRIVARWIPPGLEWLEPSTPFQYLVADDSILPPPALAAHYAAVEVRARSEFERDAALDYLGERPGTLARPLLAREIAERFDPTRVPAGFATAERAIDTAVLARALRRAVADARGITFAPSHVARAITQAGDAFVVEGDGPEGPWRFAARQVVNALWERRVAFDRQLGIAPPPHLLHRLKYRVIAELPPALRGAPSVTMVLGRYGDVVVRGDGTAYLSWYPAGLQGWSHDAEPPAEWDAACRGAADPATASRIVSAILSGLDAWFPGIARCTPRLVDAGVIVAIGRSDVDDPASALHDRSHIGVDSHGGYHSIDPGKLTTAPLFAIEAADRIAARHTAGASS